LRSTIENPIIAFVVRLYFAFEKKQLMAINWFEFDGFFFFLLSLPGHVVDEFDYFTHLFSSISISW
jgi:hypothetical protein